MNTLIMLCAGWWTFLILILNRMQVCISKKPDWRLQFVKENTLSFMFSLRIYRIVCHLTRWMSRQNFKASPKHLLQKKSKNEGWMSRIPEHFISAVYVNDYIGPRQCDRLAKRWMDQVKQNTDILMATVGRQMADRRGLHQSSWLVGASGYGHQLCQ